MRNAKPSDKTQRLFDSGGLYLEILPAGGRYWRWKYRFAGKEKRLALGVYPAVTLRAARASRDEARQVLQQGNDPAAIKKANTLRQAVAAGNTFKSVALRWFDRRYADKKNSTRDQVKNRLEKDVFPWLGDLAVDAITTQDVIATIERIDARGATDLAGRAFLYISRILKYADTLQLVPRDVSASIDAKLIITQRAVKHHAAITQPDEVHALMRALQGYTGSFVVRCGLLISAYTFLRPGELRHAVWAEFDLDNALWTIPTPRTKMRVQDHLVPLSSQAVSVLHELHAITGKYDFVFPSERTHKRPMSENAINGALRRLGYAKNDMTAHGFRAMARTVLDEHLGFRPDFIEHQLGHAVRDPNGRAYNRTAHLAERKVMMQAWADFLHQNP